MAGINAAARRGILIRDAVALEKSGTITAVAFDKTGTLTAGRPALVRCLGLPGGSDSDPALLAVAAALAAPSNHPLSRAIAEAGHLAGGANPPGTWREHPGLGIEASEDNGGKVRTRRLGSLRWLESLGIDVTAARAHAEAGAAQGNAAVVLAEDSTATGLLLIGDPIRPDAPELVRQLAASGRTVHLVSGDSRAACLFVARAAGIPESQVHAECRPEGKTAILRALRDSGQRVAFVGDGINDSPALATADLGIAVGSASDVAREAADVVLLRPGLDAVAEALDLSQRTLHTIHQNLFWAFFYNAAAVPLAALGFISPVVCALTMGLSDVIVVGNALRLLRRR
jgi:Cu+-exporting ATPase